VTHILDDLQWRGLLQDSTGLDDLRKDMDAGQVTFYVGFDPTAASLHLGHLTQVLTARRLQLAGHRPLALVGGATGQIGDPKESGERTLNDPEVTAGWVAKIRTQVEPFFDFEGPAAATMVNNLDWTAPMSAIEFLRDVGKHFPVNKMLAREVVKARLETGISFTEFSYQLLQAHDFFELHRRYGCQLQYGGSDQWGNITAGVDYIRRRGAGPVQAFVTPLVTKSDGTKFGKTEGGAVWLDPELTSPYAFYQFWVNADDRDVERYLKLFTFLRLDQIAAAMAEHGKDPGRRTAQRVLAREVTATVHGLEAAEEAMRASEALFGGQLDLEALPDMPTRAVARAEVLERPILEALLASGLASSKADARRGIEGRGFYLNGQAIERVDATLRTDDLHGPAEEPFVILRKGKKNYVRLVLSP
jgi:tyrosyl-tRNA synthetase